MGTKESSIPDGGLHFRPQITEGKLLPKKTYFPLSEPKTDPLLEEQRRIIAGVKEVDPNNWRAFNEFASNYFNLLNKPNNKIHFVGVPETLEEFKVDLKSKGTHPLAVFNNLNEVVAFATIKDPARGERDGVLKQFVVVNNLQNAKWGAGEEIEPISERPKGVGRQSLGAVFDWAFSHPTYDGRRRERIDIYVMVVADEGKKEIPNWTRMRRLLKDAGARVVYYNEDTADVPSEKPEGEELVGDSLRFYLVLDAWGRNRYKFSKMAA